MKLPTKIGLMPILKISKTTSWCYLDSLSGKLVDFSSIFFRATPNKTLCEPSSYFESSNTRKSSPTDDSLLEKANCVSISLGTNTCLVVDKVESLK